LILEKGEEIGGKPREETKWGDVIRQRLSPHALWMSYDGSSGKHRSRDHARKVRMERDVLTVGM
jgi:hypothetical protein